MRRAAIGGLCTGAAAVALAALLGLARSSTPPAPAPLPARPDPGFADAVALLAGETAPLPREYSPPSLEIPLQPIPEPGTAALVALGLAALPRLARFRPACHPAR